jgi:hypothetical protein
MVNNRTQCKVAIIFVTFLIFMSSLNSAYADVYTMDATLQQGFPLAINETEEVWGSIDFGHGFSAIESISVNMVFGTDTLYFPTDTTVIGFPSPFGYMGMSYFSGVETLPLNEYSFDASFKDAINALMCGSTSFYIEMLKGSIDITSIKFQVTGTAGQPPVYTLSTFVIGGHGTIAASLSGPYNKATVVLVSATPDFGYRVKAWTGTDDDTSKNNTIPVTLYTSRTVTVEFEPISPELITYTLNAYVLGSHGMISAPIAETYYEGTIVDLIATPDSGYQVMEWIGTDNDTSKSNTNTVTMNAPRTVMVEFEPVVQTTGGSGSEDKIGSGSEGGGCFISTTSLK